MKILFLISSFMAFGVCAQGLTPSLQDISADINKTLPGIYDPITKLMSTTVRNGNLYYHFVIRATKEEFDQAVPNVQKHVKKSICHLSRERLVLLGKGANIVYSYENEKGQSLGEFMVKPEDCGKGH